MSDAAASLGGLYLGETFCCEVAADLDANEVLELADVVQLLFWLFLGSDPPPEPYKVCGFMPRSTLSCDVEADKCP